jgi:hypothetical protein
MVGKVVALLFGCRHRRMTRPITPVYKFGTPPGDSYVRCLECGKRFSYDTRNMRVGMTMPTNRPPHRDVSVFQSQQ